MDCMDVLDDLKITVGLEPTRDGGYDLPAPFMQLIYDELHSHVVAGRLIRIRDVDSVYRYIKNKKGIAGTWWRSPYDLTKLIEEIENLRDGGHPPSFEKRIAQALDVITGYAGFDGAHHKDWVIDQVVRILVGNEDYPQWVADVCDGEDGPNTYEWSEGTAP